MKIGAIAARLRLRPQAPVFRGSVALSGEGVFPEATSPHAGSRKVIHPFCEAPHRFHEKTVWSQAGDRERGSRTTRIVARYKSGTRWNVRLRAARGTIQATRSRPHYPLLLSRASTLLGASRVPCLSGDARRLIFEMRDDKARQVFLLLIAVHHRVAYDYAHPQRFNLVS
jgi:hypothetical protein